MEEIWKRVEDAPDYEISNMGRLRNSKGRYLKGGRNMGYIRDVLICADGTKRRFYRHRLVASAFIPNPQGKRCVNHIDNNGQNDVVTNLEWCTHQENTDWMVAQGRNKRTDEWVSRLRKSIIERCGKPIIATCIATGEETYYRTAVDASKLGFQRSCICCCCEGKRETHKGYRFRYAL